MLCDYSFTLKQEWWSIKGHGLVIISRENYVITYPSPNLRYVSFVKEASGGHSLCDQSCPEDHLIQAFNRCHGNQSDSGRIFTSNIHHMQNLVVTNNQCVQTARFLCIFFRRTENLPNINSSRCVHIQYMSTIFSIFFQYSIYFAFWRW